MRQEGQEGMSWRKVRKERRTRSREGVGGVYVCVDSRMGRARKLGGVTLEGTGEGGFRPRAARPGTS